VNADNARVALARLLLRVLRRRTKELDAAALAESAVVFAPHPDDEVLGCGGTILEKRRIGAPVTLVFMTDGGLSHPTFIAPEELQPLRRAEALESAARLGIASTDVIFLDFEDKGLDAQAEAARARVAIILRELAPQQIFVPCAQDWHRDHVATNRIIRRALASVRHPPWIYEYSVYQWKAWPFSSDAGYVDGLTFARFARSVLLNATMAIRLTHSVAVNQPEQKRAALDAHRTQTEKPAQFPDWRVLGEWGQGDFLRWHWSGCEFFRRRAAARSRGS